MRHGLSVAFALCVAAVFSARTLDAQPPARNAKVEQAIEQKLAAIAPSAVASFQHATVAMDKRDYPQCDQLYRDVLKQAPEFTPALRRLGVCLMGEGKTDDGLALIQKAVQIEGSAENYASLAQALAFPGGGRRATAEDLAKAMALAKQANALAGNTDDPSYAMLTAQLAWDLRDNDTFRQATNQLVRKHPELMATHYFNAVLLATDRKWISSENEIKQAGRMGMPAANVQAFLDSGIHKHALEWKAMYGSGGLILALILGSLFLRRRRESVLAPDAQIHPAT